MAKNRNAKIRPQTATARRESPTYEEIAALAYRLWEESGYREGHADEDWARAERILREGGERERTPLAAIA